MFGTAKNLHYVQLRSDSKFKRLAFEFPEIIKEHNIDYAHFQYISPSIKCCKEIVTIHDLLFLDFPQYFLWLYRVKNRLLFGRSAHRADILFTVSEYSRNEIIRHFDIVKERISITPNAVLPIDGHVALPDIYDKVGCEKYILTVGRIEPRKNFHILLKAFVELKLYERNYKLVVIGIPDLSDTLFNNYYSSLSDEVKRAVVMDTASFPELVALYKNASLFVFPSLAEGFGIPPLEAIEYGCPLLCSNATAMAEFGLPDEYMFNPNDVEELKMKMSNALANRCVLADSTKIKEKYNWKKSADVLYRKILEKENEKDCRFK